MNKFKLLFIILLVGLMTPMQSCNSTKVTGETVSLKNSNSGELSVLASGYGRNKKSSISNAIENAFRNILLRGIPGSNQSTPLLGNQAESVFKDNKRFFEDFLKDGTSGFILDKNNSKFNFLKINEPSSSIELLINLSSLRTHLTQQGIIREFGF